MRAQEFVKDYAGLSLKISRDADGVAIRAYSADGAKELGMAEFFYDEQGRLDPQTVWVNERYHGQGIAAAMYDYLKSRGYTIIRSWDQTDAGRGFWNKHRGPEATVWETRISEGQDARTEIEAMANILPGSPDEYFVRFTDQDKVGFSARQHFGRTPDIDDPGYDPLALPRPSGRPALWFYPLRTYLRGGDLFASQHPYTWLVRLRPDAWLQRVGQEGKTEAPQGKTRVGMIRQDQGVPMAIFFKPAFDVVDRWYDYGKTHKRRQ